MTINFTKALCLAGAAAVVYCIHNTIATSSYGYILPNAAQGFATGAVTGLATNFLDNLPIDIKRFSLMGATSIAAYELAKGAINAHHSTQTGLTFVIASMIGFVQTSNVNLKTFGIA